MKLSIHLVVKNHQSTIKESLESALPLGGRIVVADLGCTDSTVALCRQYGAKIVRPTGDYSQIRNALIAESGGDWILMIEPWEAIFMGHAVLVEKMKQTPHAYQLQIIKDDLITKETRLWHGSLGLKYVNPVYETLNQDKATGLPVFLRSSGGRKYAMDAVQQWRLDKPLATEPLYYEACTLLLEKKWKQFLNVANHYIFLERTPKMSLTMCRYYCAMVMCYILKDYQSAIQYLLPCLADKPTMAEFWCLLGDVHYAAKVYDKAKAFYDNAIVLGSRRLKTDDWPFEISKYKEYPKKMIEACDVVIASAKMYGQDN